MPLFFFFGFPFHFAIEKFFIFIIFINFYFFLKIKMKKFFFFSFFLIILLFNLTFSEDEKVFFLLKDRKDSCFKTWTTEFPFQIESKRILLSNSLLSSNEPILFQNSFWIKTNLSSFESNWNFTLIAQETLVTEAFEQRWRNLANSKDLDSWKFAKVFLITSENEVTWNQTWIETIPFAHVIEFKINFQ